MNDSSEKLKTIRITTIVGMIINIVLAAAKFIAGILCSCQALIADAVHSTSDLVTDIAVIAGVKYWTRPPDRGHPYGHARIETLVTALIGLMLAFVGFEIGLEAVKTLFHGNPGGNIDPGITFIIALSSILSKEWLYRWTVRKARKIDSAAMEANAWHHRSDALSSIPVAVSILITLVFPKLWYVDQIGAIIVSIFILYAAWEIMKPALNELSDSSAPPEFCRRVHDEAMTVDGVLAVHAVRARRLGPSFDIDMHILINGDRTVRDGHHIAHQVHDKLVNLAGFNIADVVVHVEPFSQNEDAETQVLL